MWNSIGNIFSAPEGGATDKHHKKGSSGVRPPPGPLPPRSTQLPTYGSNSAGHPAAPSGGFFNLPSASAGAGGAGSGFHSHPPALQATLAPPVQAAGGMFG